MIATIDPLFIFTEDQNDSNPDKIAIFKSKINSIQLDNSNKKPLIHVNGTLIKTELSYYKLLDFIQNKDRYNIDTAILVP